MLGECVHSKGKLFPFDASDVVMLERVVMLNRLAKVTKISGVVRLANSQQSLRGTTVRAHLVGGDVVHFVDEIYGGVAF